MLRRTVMLVGIMVFAVTTVQAQERRQRGGAFGGPGGFFGVSGSQLLGMPEVQKELGVSDEQKGLIEDMVADLREKMREAFAGQDFQNLSREEREKAMGEARKKGEEIQKKSDEMVTMILEPKQMERLQQLKLQREGVGALNRDETAQKIGLSEEQREKIRKIQEDARSEQRQGGGNFQNLSEEERRELMNRFRERMEKINSDILAVLTSEQRANWDKMQGKKFDFPPPQFGRRPGGDR